MSVPSPADAISRAFDDAVIMTLSSFMLNEVSLEKAPLLITDGLIARVEMIGTWHGAVTVHCSDAALDHLGETMAYLLTDIRESRDTAVMKLVSDAVANSFMTKFLSKSLISPPKIIPWEQSRQERIKDTREMRRVQCCPNGAPISIALVQNLTNLATE